MIRRISFITARQLVRRYIIRSRLFAYWAYYEAKKQQLPNLKPVVTVHPHELMGSHFAVGGFSALLVLSYLTRLENWDDL
jgi:phosphatidylglycerol:prolipoprotein diacylglycerol transferase